MRCGISANRHGAALWQRDICLGFSPGSNNPNYSFTAARIKQYGDLAIAAWTSSRPRSQLYLFNQSATWDLGNANISQFKGTSLDAVANKIYGAYGGVGGGKASRITSHPIGRSISAMRWVSRHIGGRRGLPVTSTISRATFRKTHRCCKPQRTMDLVIYAKCYSALYDQFYGTVTRSSGSAGGATFTYYKTKVYPQLELIAASFDQGRSKKISIIHYEGGPQFGVGNINNGTNDDGDRYSRSCLKDKGSWLGCQCLSQ